MTGLIKDIGMLVKMKLPHYFDRKRLILNFLFLYVQSIPNRLFVSEKKDNSVDGITIESDIWKTFNSILSVYVKYINPKFLLNTYLIRVVASGWGSKKYMDFLNDNFKDEHKDIIAPTLVDAVSNVSQCLADEFSGLDYLTVNQWLLTYQYGLSYFADSEDSLLDMLENVLIIELGAGVGANAAVHASLSNKGVFVYDIPPMLQIQKIVLNKVATKLDLSDISYYSDPDKLMADASKQPYIICSYWAFTEFPESLRKKLEPLIDGAELSFFACNSVFEGTDNLDYFKELEGRLPNKVITTKPINWNSYKKHSYVMVR